MTDAGTFKVAFAHNNGRTVPKWVADALSKEGIHLVARDCETGDELVDLAADADLVWLFSESQIVSDETLPLLKQCGAILRTGSGTDNIPIDAATRAGIVVTNTPAGLADAVSDHTIGLLLGLARRVTLHDRAVRKGIWDRELSVPLILRGKAVGIVGFGHIGQRVAKKLSGFDMCLLVCDPFADDAAVAQHGASKVELDELLEQSDFVLLHCALTDDTFHLIDEAALERMKPTAYLINTSRGPVVDETALTRALQAEWIAGAGLDVFEDEPPAVDNPLFSLENVVLTAHIASHSEEFFDQLYNSSIETIVDLKNGRWPASIVNRGVKPRWTLVPK